jgi:prevent-host-death family protein
MMSVAVRELRNNTAAVMAKVRGGETVYLTSHGERIAKIVPVDPYLKPYLTPAEAMAFPKADFGLFAVITQDGDFDALRGLGGPEVIHV